MIVKIIDQMVKIITEKQKIFQDFEDFLDHDNLFSDVKQTDCKFSIINYFYNKLKLLISCMFCLIIYLYMKILIK